MSCKIFKLIHGDDELLLEDEPVKWDNLELTLKRDEDWHGVNYEFSDGEVQLEFDCVAGADFIDAIYGTEGLDADILFRYEDGILPPWEGRLLLSTFRRFNGRVSCTVERRSLHDLVKSRFDTKADLFATNDADGGALPPPAVESLPFHSKEIAFNFDRQNIPPASSDAGQVPPASPYLIYLDTQDPDNTSTLQGMTQRPFAIVQRNQVEPILTSVGDGNHEIAIMCSYWIQFKLTRRHFWQRLRLESYRFETILEIRDENGDIKYSDVRLHALQTSIDNGETFTFTSGRQEFNFTRKIGIGWQLYVYGRFTFSWGGRVKLVQAKAELYESSIRIEALSQTPPTFVKGMLIHEAVDRALAVNTGRQGTLWSDFIGRIQNGYPVDGCGSRNFITNGFQLRQFKEDRSIQVSPKDLLESLRAIYSLGLGYESDSEGNERVRVESIGHFYRDEPENASEIIFIPDCDEYEELAAHELVYNKIEIGYAKYPEEGAELLDEFNTRHEYTTPIKRHDNGFSQISQLIASGYAIEMTRREQFSGEKRDKKSTKYDDDKFIVAVRLAVESQVLPTFGTIRFNAATKSINAYVPLTGALTFGLGDVLRVSSGPNAGEYIVQAVSSTPSLITDNGAASLYYTIIVAEELVNQVVTSTNFPRPTLTVESTRIETERDQAFTVTPGTLLSSYTAYNLRLSPKRMLLNWARWLNGGMMFKSGSEAMKNTFVKQNPDLTTRLHADDPCPLGDLGRDTIREGDDVRLAAFGERERLFIPDWVTFVARLDPEDIDRIRAAMTNRSLGVDNYGYISVLSPEGHRVSGWLYEMRWSPATEKVFFRLLKYKVLLNNTVPPDQENCQDYADWTFADFEASDIGAWIEDCRFEDFN